MGYRVKDWSQFQHFKDRTPPWIKLYRDILDDPDWHALDPADAKTLVMLWLIASEDKTHSGALPDARKLAFRLRMTEKQVNQTLERLSHWLEQDDIKAISQRYQVDAPEESRGEADIYAPEDSANHPTPQQRHRIGFDGSQFVGINGELEVWKSAYPAIDVEAEIRKAAAWLVANPANKKKQFGRFINGWLSRAQEKAPRVATSAQKDWI